MRQNWRFTSLMMAVILIFITNSCFASNTDSGINSTKDNNNDSSKVSLGDAKIFLCRRLFGKIFII